MMHFRSLAHVQAVLAKDVQTANCSMGAGEGKEGQPLHALREVS